MGELGLAAAHMAALGAHPEVEGAAALLARVGPRRGYPSVAWVQVVSVAPRFTRSLHRIRYTATSIRTHAPTVAAT
jgi:hypothetical protein